MGGVGWTGPAPRAIGWLVVVALAACGSREGCPDDAYCPATAPVCNLEADECIACTTSEACEQFDDLPICRNGECVACTPGMENPDYCPGFVCVEGARCRPCLTGSECLSGLCWDSQCLDEGEVLYVEAGGSPTSDCTREDPCGEIGRAVELAEGYRRYVHVASGEYAESVEIDQATVAALLDHLVLFGDPPAVIAPAVDGAPAIAVDGVIVLIKDLELVGAIGADGHGVSCVDGHIAVRDSQIRDGGGDGIAAVGCVLIVERTSVLRNGRSGASHDGGSLTITDSVFADNAELGISIGACDYADATRTVVAGNRGGGVRAGCNFSARNDLFVANGSTQSSVGGVELGAPYSVLEFCTVSDNRASTSAPASGVSCPSSMTYVIDSIVADNAADPPQLASCTVRSSLVSPGPPPKPGQNFTGDPGFVSPADGNYDIGPDSAAIDRAAGTIPDDLHGDPRGPDPGDVGADEYHAP
jgi:hypothetical protein